MRDKTLAPTAPRCPALRRDGQPCGATPTRGGWCFFHSPTVSPDAKLLAVTKGGHASRPTILPEARDPRLRSPEDIRSFLSQTAGACTRGELDVGIGNHRVYAASVALKTFELDVLARVDELEKLVNQRRGNW